LRKQVDELAVREAAARRRERILALIQEHDLPLPASEISAASSLVGLQFIESLMQAPNEQSVQRLVEERAELIRSAGEFSGERRNDRRPRSREQLALSAAMGAARPRNGQEFAAAIRKR
jgi:hypothetical protein